MTHENDTNEWESGNDTIRSRSRCFGMNFMQNRHTVWQAIPLIQDDKRYSCKSYEEVGSNGGRVAHDLSLSHDG